MVDPGSEFDVFLQVTQAGSRFNAFHAVVGYDPNALTLIPLSPLSLQEGTLMTSACSNRFHTFREGADRDTIDETLLCNQTFVTGPGQIYRLHYRASTTRQITTVRFIYLYFVDAGIYVHPVDSTDVRIGIGMPVAVPPSPLSTSLARPEPNPFHAGVVLSAELAAPGPLGVAIYSADGRRVKTLAQGRYQPGSYRWIWNGGDERGAQAAPGLYFVRMTTQEGISTRRLVYLR
jgi:hypothetical protein